MLLHENRWHLKNVQMCNATIQASCTADEQITAMITGRGEVRKEGRKNQGIPFRWAAPSVAFPRETSLSFPLRLRLRRGERKAKAGKRLRAPARRTVALPPPAAAL